MEDNRRTKLSEPTSKVQVNSQRQKQQAKIVCTRPSAYVLQLKLSLIRKLQSVRKNGFLMFLPVLRTLLLLLGYLVELQMMVFVSSYILFCHAWLFCYLFKNFSFLKRERNGADIERKGYREELGELERGENIIRIYWMRKESISIKGNK